MNKKRKMKPIATFQSPNNVNITQPTQANNPHDSSTSVHSPFPINL